MSNQPIPDCYACPAGGKHRFVQVCESEDNDRPGNMVIIWQCVYCPGVRCSVFDAAGLPVEVIYIPPPPMVVTSGQGIRESKNLTLTNQVKRQIDTLLNDLENNDLSDDDRFGMLGGDR